MSLGAGSIYLAQNFVFHDLIPPWIRGLSMLHFSITWGSDMHTTNLRKVGGSVMMAVPPALLDLLHIGAGAKVGLSVDNGRLVVNPQQRPRYTLDELLAQCDGPAEQTDNDRSWLNDNSTGNELI
jgi:antitoxin ChpS